MLLILGATGQVGAQVLSALAMKGTTTPSVRVLVRRPDALVIPDGLTVEVHHGTYDDREALLRALDGVTDVLLATGDSPGQIEREFKIIDWAKASGGPRIIKISAITASLQPRVSVGIAHGSIEDHLKRSGLGWVVLQPTFFYQSLALFSDPVRKFGVFPLPTHQGAIAFVNVKDIGTAVAHIAADRSITSRTFAITGPEAWRLEEVCAALGDRLGRRIRHVNPSRFLFQAMLTVVGGVSWEYAGLTAGVARACAEGWEGNVTSDFESLVGRRPLGLDAYLDESLNHFGLPK